jgi:hypothetical protein
MKFAKLLPLLAACALLFSVGAFAKDKEANAGKFELMQPARVGSTQLQAGQYEAEWTGPATDLKISILKHGKTVATAEGQLKELPAAATHDAVTVRTLNDKTVQVDEIDFSRRAEALVLSGM